MAAVAITVIAAMSVHTGTTSAAVTAAVRSALCDLEFTQEVPPCASLGLVSSAGPPLPWHVLTYPAGGVEVPVEVQGLRLKSKLKRRLAYPAGGICYPDR